MYLAEAYIVAEIYILSFICNNMLPHCAALGHNNVCILAAIELIFDASGHFTHTPK